MERIKSIPNTDVSGIEMHLVNCRNKKCKNTFKTHRKTKLGYCSIYCAQADGVVNNPYFKGDDKKHLTTLANQDDEVMEHDEVI